MKKIMFNDAFSLTQAVIDGRKTMTRRIEPGIFVSEGVEREWINEMMQMHHSIRAAKSEISLDGEKYFSIYTKYALGEVVAVAQKYADIIARISPTFNPHAYDWMRTTAGWNNKMFVKADLLPTRIKIKKIKLERLQDITEEDCIKEGLEWDGKANKFYSGYNKNTGEKNWLENGYKESFATLINKIVGKETWNNNPWTVVYEFELQK